MKKTKYFLSVLILSVLFFGNNAFSQGLFNIHGGFVMPNGDWGDDDITDDNSGLQGTGFTVGAEGVIPLTDQGLGLFIGGDINLTGMKKSAKDDIESAYADPDYYTLDITYPKSINIPISAGLHYQYKPNEKIALYGKGGLALSFLKVSKLTIEEKDKSSSDTYTATTTYDMANSMGLVLGGGVIVNDKVIIGLNYFGLGEHTVKGKTKYEANGVSDPEKDDVKMKLKVSYISLTIGIKL
jgi:hypothetical protein